ncbi:hypothetical protein Kfla_2572 [Kribbella flavida DSM 17836]|uniref:Uncharacterized protein n=1 Tax=Kribbella flavida (strain DSM 17836 / JCM 10339 / NBRC 14399) TaxID=479435 RepID=D2PXJ8_KRIFD|nr:hypothetical protein [Kribbella flavida]ADB31640.1 hypothetical protein Kfla_2572 [Kribbella flavida DSM 17836]
MTENPVPPWANRLAHLIPFLVLPSGLWRLGLVAGSSMGMLDDGGRPAQLHGWGEHVYIVCLTLFSEAVALTAFGLVRRWGEVVPGWIPWLGGRRVAPYAAIVPATLGGLSLIAIWTYGFRDAFSGDFLPFASDAGAALMIACYAPLQLWGPALLVLTWAYYRRRVTTVQRARGRGFSRVPGSGGAGSGSPT